ncbi:FAD-binding oxidoreductase [Streptomyces sp. ISL-94]|uniref:FAD-binding oxidoreductase n=1 Tax=Streptomyces sp. ISL-94 TaxID=2819190 RepID=UPI001BE7D314|nr:hypothetical protein [Streptomyces sp. ISL-94]MBT2477778.1 FAD-binding oxidoreductase [Streptomyces sp. ISL-94]
MGRLARRYGLSCDNLRAAEVVTADGRVVRADESDNADLFWGLRGAGANFGVTTSLEFQLHRVGPEVLGGVVVHPLKKAKAALSLYGEYSLSAPDELSADAIFLTSPDGDPLLAISACYIGSVEEGERVLRPLRRFGPPLVDGIGPVAYTELQAAADAFFPTGLRYYGKSHFPERIADDTVEATVDGTPMADHAGGCGQMREDAGRSAEHWRRCERSRRSGALQGDHCAGAPAVPLFHSAHIGYDSQVAPTGIGEPPDSAAR